MRQRVTVDDDNRKSRRAELVQDLTVDGLRLGHEFDRMPDNAADAFLDALLYGLEQLLDLQPRRRVRDVKELKVDRRPMLELVPLTFRDVVASFAYSDYSLILIIRLFYYSIIVPMEILPHLLHMFLLI